MLSDTIIIIIIIIIIRDILMGIFLLLNISNLFSFFGFGCSFNCVHWYSCYTGGLLILLAIRVMDYSSSNLHAACSSRLLTHPISRTLESVAIKVVNAAVKPDAAKP
jgi:NO-binding membrane sensor protein with MHYT domain